MVAVSPENDVGTAFQQECCQSGARIVLARCRTDAPRASTIRVNHQDSETRRACVDLLIASCPPSFRKRCQKRVQGSLWDSAPWGGPVRALCVQSIIALNPPLMMAASSLFCCVRGSSRCFPHRSDGRSWQSRCASGSFRYFPHRGYGLSVRNRRGNGAFSRGNTFRTGRLHARSSVKQSVFMLVLLQDRHFRL